MSKVDSKAPRMGSIIVANTQKPSYQNNVLKGTISPIIPEERPAESEVSVGISIRDVRYGDKGLVGPEAVTIFNGLKHVEKIPFKEELVFWFARVENEMIFKFAITASGELVGFLYLELPSKFKTMKEFRLDDWFPVKIASAEKSAVSVENFVARLSVNYKARRALEPAQLMPSKAPRPPAVDEITRGLKARVDELHKELDPPADEGFRFLVDIQRKILRKKIMNRQIKPQLLDKPPEPEGGNDQIDPRGARKVVTEDPRVKAAALPPSRLFAFEEKRIDGPDAHEKLMKELAQTQAALVEQRAKLDAEETSKTVPENLTLRRKVKEAQDVLAEERAKLAAKLRGQNVAWAQAQAQAEATVAELRAQVSALTKAQSPLVESVTADEARVARLQAAVAAASTAAAKAQRSNDATGAGLYAGREAADRDGLAVEAAEEELAEARRKIVADREALLAAASSMSAERAAAEAEAAAAEAAEIDAADAEAAEEAALAAEAAEVDAMAASASAATSNGLEYSRQAEAERKDFAAAAAVLADERRALKIEAVRVWREKAALQEKIASFLAAKKRGDAAIASAAVDADFEFVEAQLRELEREREDFDQAKNCLEAFETAISRQRDELISSARGFVKAQKHFFARLENSDFDAKELEAFAQKFGIDLAQTEKRWREDERYNAELNRLREAFSRSAANAGHGVGLSPLRARRATLAQGRKSAFDRRDPGRQRFTLLDNPGDAAFASLDPTRQRLILAERADALIERVFSSSTLALLGGTDRSPAYMIDEYKRKVEYLEREIQLEKNLVEKLRSQGAETPTQASSEPRGQLSRRSFASLESVHIPEQLNQLQNELLESFAQVEKSFENEAHSAENQRYLSESKRLISKVFAGLALIHNGKKEFDNALIGNVYIGEEFDSEKLKAAFEAKVATLVAYIMRIRDSYEFFNNNMDNEILRN